MAFSVAKEWLAACGLADRITEFSASSATVELAAEALGCDPAHIAKTMSFKSGDGALLVVTAGDVKIDNHKFKEAFGFKASMLPHDAVEVLIGHAVGGVCPFGVPETVPVYLDVSLKRFETVYPACGSANSAVRLSIPELEKSSAYRKWVDVCKAICDPAKV